MFGLKKSGMHIDEFCKKLENAVDKKPYGLSLAEALFRLFSGYFQDSADCVVCYEYGGREMFFEATMPEDEAAFYKKDLHENTETERIKGNKTVRIRTDNGALRGLWVLEMYPSCSEDMEDSYREKVSVIQMAFSACLLAEELQKEQLRDCVTGLFGNEAFEEALRQFMGQGSAGYLIAARRPVRYPRPYIEDGMNGSARTLAAACKKSGIPDIYRIGEDMVALLCLEDQEKAYAVAQEIADMGETDLYVTEFSALENGKVYSMIQQNLDSAEESGAAFGLHYHYPKLPVCQDSVEGA